MRYIDLKGPEGNATVLWGIAIDLAKKAKTEIFGFDPKSEKDSIYQKFETMPYEETVKFIRDNYPQYVRLHGDDWEVIDDE